MGTIDCKKCLYFYVTWDKTNPMGCKRFAFKSRQLPSEVVLKASGEPCGGFEAKIIPR